MPYHPIALALIRAAGGYIAAPSANTSGRPSPTRAEHVKEDLDGRIDMIIDGGEVCIGLESTIVDMTGEIPCLLRPGYISLEDLRDTLGRVDVDPAIEAGREADADTPPKAPGMKYRHYAPKGELTLVRGKADDVVAGINSFVEQMSEKGKRTAVFCVGGHGRTGYVAACVLYRLGIGNPIVFLREKYSVFAVESSEQELAGERFIEAEKQKRRPGVGQWQSRRERGSGNVHTESEGPSWRMGDREDRTLC
jgi:hypothetical protein